MRQVAVALFCFVLLAGAPIDAAKVGGKIAPTGEEIQIDFPDELMRANVSSRGQGCCVFTSIHHAALWQNVPALQEFPKWLQSHGLTGGGHPGNVDDRIKAICKERGLPVPAYIQVEGKMADNLDVLRLACGTGRMPAVTYGLSPTHERYNGQKIAHMVSIVHANTDSFCTLDNNYIGLKNLEWSSAAEFGRAHVTSPDPRAPQVGWIVILLDPGPPPLPWN